MTAEIVSVGTELLLGQIVDTHAPVMAQILAECGISCTRRATVGDNMDRLVQTLREALDRADILVTIGGLGPTVDDLTRDAIALALGDELVKEPDVEERLRKFFSLRSIRWTESIARQAERPESAKLIDNPNGTAPGLLCQKNGKIVIALPGPKGEFNPMARGPVKEFLSTIQGNQVIHSRTLRIVGMGESHVEDAIRPLMDNVNPTVAPYAHTGEVHLRVTARASTAAEADEFIDPVAEEIGRILGDALFGTDDTTLEAATLELLTDAGATVAVAESMTGGELGARLTNVPGCSSAVVGGVISYSLEVKQRLLGVPKELLDAHGPVSAETAQAMAEGARDHLRATYGVAITGNAGPDSDVDNKPVGLVYVAVAGPLGTQVEESRYRGVREDIRRRATQNALLMLRRALLNAAAAD